MRAAPRGLARIAPALLLAGAWGCGSSGPRGAPEPDPTLRWFEGDLHVHSTPSNDAPRTSTPETIRDVAVRRGLDFVVLTDHSNSTGSFERCAPGADRFECIEEPPLFNLGPEFPLFERAIELSEPGRFLMVDGNEISPITGLDQPLAPRGHLGCIPRDLASFGGRDPGFAFVDRPRGAVSGGESIAVAHELGCWVVLHHAYAPVVGSWTAYDWTSRDYDAMEIWNGSAGFDFGDRNGLLAWLCDLSQGKATVPIGSSDNHDTLAEVDELTTPILGSARTSVLAGELAWPAVMEALAAGRTVVHDETAFVDVSLERGGRVLARPGGWARVRRDAALTFHVRGRSDVPAELVLAHVARGSCVDLRTPGRSIAPEIPILEDAVLAVDGAFDLRLEVPFDGDAHYFARTRSTNPLPVLAGDMAITNAIAVEAR